MSIAKEIQPFVSAVLADIEGNWDFDDSMAVGHVQVLSYGRLLVAIHKFDRRALEWLTYFVARRGLSCWELSCRDTRPRRIVEQLGKYLLDGGPIEWSDVVRATPSPFNDCRFSDTQSASEAVAECARYISGHNPINSVYCVSSADVAYDHVLTDHRFREWFIRMAVPVALEKREMDEAEREALRP